ncbi:MAG: DUF3549 family protein [Gammaproteobacteria bacterium]|nr:DUF3549 family protein [Gammaproteobacteria bacterium]MCF6362823.1 DUF3549 family protein [Gammaproteobacteria bacterium]
MTTTLTLTDFLDQIGTLPRFFGLGRRISEIPRERFTAFENAEEPWPQPFQQAAWLGILFNDTQTGEPHLWFLRFPLDEQGLLMQAARDEFLHRIIDSAGQPGSAADPSTDQLGDNPFGFKPNEAQMANLHARIAFTQGQPASPQYAHTLEYFSGEQGFEQWQFVGLQGIADLAIRHDVHAELLTRAIPQLPTEPFNVLCGCLENETIGDGLVDALAARLYSELAADNPDPVLIAATLRGLSNGAQREKVIATTQATLNSELGKHPEILAAIAGRAWETLYDNDLRTRFLLRLAESGQRAFDSILADLLFLPVLRNLLLADIRGSQLPQEVQQTITGFIQRFAQDATNRSKP